MTAGLAGRCVTKGALSGPQHPSTIMAVARERKVGNGNSDRVCILPCFLQLLIKGKIKSKMVRWT